MIPETKVVTVGLPKKFQQNDLEEYKSMNPLGPQGTASMGVVGVDQIVKYKIQQMQSHPQHYFNFGFTYNDFKAYLMKLTYCRSMRKFIQRKRMERITQFKRNNQVMFGEIVYGGQFDMN